MRSAVLTAQLCSQQEPLLLERLCATTTFGVLRDFDDVSSIKITARKSRIMPQLDSVGVSFERRREARVGITDRSSAHPHVVYAGIGSNLGDRSGNIELALRMLESHDQIDVVATSFLYESEPMYLAQQDPFLNAVIKVSRIALPI